MKNEYELRFVWVWIALLVFAIMWNAVDIKQSESRTLKLEQEVKELKMMVDMKDQVTRQRLNQLEELKQ